jgi:hypothetical protein
MLFNLAVNYGSDMCFGQKENFFSILQNGQALRPVLKIAA